MKDKALTEEDIAYIKTNFTYDPESGVVVKVSKSRAEGGNRGWTDKQGYLRFSKCNGRILAAHRIALVLSGQCVNGRCVDHINGNTKDNRPENLRLTNKTGNMRNTKKTRRNKSGVVGVSWHKWRGKWQAFIGNVSRDKHLGYFDDFFEAVCARKSAENRLGYHPNHGRR